MGRWLNKVQKYTEGTPTKPTEPAFVSFVSTASSSFQENESIGLTTTNGPRADRVWLHLMVVDGCVTQRTGDQKTAIIKGEAHMRYGDKLMAVVPVPGFERPLTEEEVIKALAGTLGAPAALPLPSDAWLFRVARLLGVQPAELLDSGYLEPHDLIEQAGTAPELVAETIRRSPAWISRS
jgi:hypothetical protein